MVVEEATVLMCSGLGAAFRDLYGWRKKDEASRGGLAEGLISSWIFD